MDHYSFESHNFDDLAAQSHELPDAEQLNTSLDDSITLQDDFSHNQNYLDADLNSAPDWNSSDHQLTADGLYDRIADNLDVSSYDSSGYNQDTYYGDDAHFAAQTHELTNPEPLTTEAWDHSTVYQGDDYAHQSYLDNEPNYSDASDWNSSETYSYSDHNYTYHQDSNGLEVSAYESQDYYQDSSFGDSSVAEQGDYASLHDQYLDHYQRSGSGQASEYLNDALEQEKYADEHRNSYEDFSKIADDYRAEGSNDLANKYDDKAKTEQEWVETYQEKAQDYRDKADEAL